MIHLISLVDYEPPMGRIMSHVVPSPWDAKRKQSTNKYLVNISSINIHIEEGEMTLKIQGWINVISYVCKRRK